MATTDDDTGKPRTYAAPIPWLDEVHDETESLLDQAREAGKGKATEDDKRFFDIVTNGIDSEGNPIKDKPFGDVIHDELVRFGLIGGD